MFIISKIKLKIKCPRCTFINKVSLDDVKKEREIICEGCLEVIKLLDSNNSTQKAIQDINKGINKLSNTLKKFSK